MNIQPIILSGGSGSRLWPLSREQHPKQLLPLTADVTMLQATATRLDKVPKATLKALDPIVVCNEEYRFMVAQQLQEVNKAASKIILEPFGRNTAPALTLAAMFVAQQIKPSDEPILLVMPADHVILDNDAFQKAVIEGALAAAQGCLVTFGITPTSPQTGYGYIRVGNPFESQSHHNARYVDSFVEKPNVQTAKQYLESGEYLWNSGIFMMRAAVWLAEIKRHRPDIFNACEAAIVASKVDLDFLRVNAQAFEKCPSDSIDYAVMEKAAPADVQNAGAHAVVIALDAGWSDVGAWDALWHVAQKDQSGNVVKGDVYALQTNNALLIAEHRFLACLGLDDVIVVETPDAVMVAHKDSTQEVKQIVAHLKNSKRSEYALHRKVYRPWGSYDSVDFGERFQVKRIIVNPGASLSLQMHHHRAEHWIVVKGTARVTRGDETFLLAENESTFIPIGTRHRLQNPGKMPLEMIEVQSGPYLGEDDIVRFEDTYGRG